MSPPFNFIVAKSHCSLYNREKTKGEIIMEETTKAIRENLITALDAYIERAVEERLFQIEQQETERRTEQLAIMKRNFNLKYGINE